MVEDIVNICKNKAMKIRSLHGEIPHFGVDENSMGICLGYSSTLDVHGCARLRY
jgi:hypothetical protein